MSCAGAITCQDDTTDWLNTFELPGSLDDILDVVVRDVIIQFPERVNAWSKNQPGAWGFLASQAVLKCRTSIGRNLTEIERRTVWAKMWNALEQQR